MRRWWTIFYSKRGFLFGWWLPPKEAFDSLTDDHDDAHCVWCTWEKKKGYKRPIYSNHCLPEMHTGLIFFQWSLKDYSFSPLYIFSKLTFFFTKDFLVLYTLLLIFVKKNWGRILAWLLTDCFSIESHFLPTRCITTSGQALKKWLLLCLLPFKDCHHILSKLSCTNTITVESFLSKTGSK